MLTTDEEQRVRLVLDDVPELRDVPPFDLDQLAIRLTREAYRSHDCWDVVG